MSVESVQQQILDVLEKSGVATDVTLKYHPDYGYCIIKGDFNVAETAFYQPYGWTNRFIRSLAHAKEIAKKFKNKEI